MNAHVIRARILNDRQTTYVSGHVTPFSPVRPIDVIVPVYKNAALVHACVESLLSNFEEIASYRPRLILINDSPGDAEVKSLLHGYETLDGNLTVLHNDANLGFVRSVNRGLDIAKQDRHDVLLVNSDTQTFPGTLAQLLNAAHADPQIGFASPRSNNASICSLPHSSDRSERAPEQAFRDWSQIKRTMPPYHFAPTAVGFYMFISHRVLANHGVLREDFGLGYEEENDLVMRAGKVGSRAIIVNHAFVYHRGAASFDLTDLELSAHKHKNLSRLSESHPEFLPLVRRYEQSPHFQAEHLMSGLLDDGSGRVKLVFDLSGLGLHYNGTNEHAVAVLRSMAKTQSHRIHLTAVASEESFRCHGLDDVAGLHRENPGAHGLHGIAIRLAQPFGSSHISDLQSMAPINIYAMLDTIAEDCGPLALNGNLPELWDHVAEHADGLVFTSRFTERTFCNRHPFALRQPRWQCLLPTRLSSYAKARAISKRSHVLVLGNHFAHKGSEVASVAIATAFPQLHIVALGAKARQISNLTVQRAGSIEPDAMDSLFSDASVIVLPSHVEGFGLGFMHALAAGRPIVARRIAATEEILATLDEVEGVHLFDDDSGLVQACTLALQSAMSRAKDSRSKGWDDWAEGLTGFCLSLTTRDDIFGRLVGRLKAGQSLHRLDTGDDFKHPPRPALISSAKPVNLDTLLAMDGRAFVEHAYATLLRRPVDEGGLHTYLNQLEIGVHKVDILHSLSTSPEGRLRDVKLRGLDQTLARLNRERLPLLKRMFSA